MGWAVCWVALCSCSSLPEAPKGAARVRPSDTPMNREGHFGLILLPIALENGKPMWFIVDTGSPYTILDASLEPKLGESLGSSSIHSTYGTMPGHLCRAPTLLLNGTQLQTGHKVRTADLSKPSQDLAGITHTNQRVMGVLGMDCLGHYCIQLDFASRSVRFLDSSHLNKQALGEALPLSFFFNAIYVRQNLLGEAARTRVDTGCNFDGEVKTLAFRQRFGAKRQLVEEHACGVFAGDTYSDLCIIADANLNLIGLHFLARHVVTFDFPARMMYLSRIPTQQPTAGTNGQALAR